MQAVLTHKGRSSNSGHYVAWVRRGTAWFACDDDQVYAVQPEDIEKLSGGGDWHTAYVLLYGPRVVGRFELVHVSNNYIHVNFKTHILCTGDCRARTSRCIRQRGERQTAYRRLM
jgi:hypothetical protein